MTDPTANATPDGAAVLKPENRYSYLVVVSHVLTDEIKNFFLATATEAVVPVFEAIKAKRHELGLDAYAVTHVVDITAQVDVEFNHRPDC